MTCLCLTRNRRQWLPQAIRCYREQSYPADRRELLILADGEDVRDLVPDADSVRFIRIEEGHSIGAKRNFGCGRASGELVAHWDDDDYSAPGRLWDQVERIQTSGLAVTGYRSLRFTNGSEWWQYEGAPLFACGTSLCYRRDWWAAHRFAAVQVGEDNAFVRAAAEAEQLIVSDAGTLMYATIHPENTSPRNLAGFRRLSA